MKKFLFLIFALAVTESQCKVSSGKDRIAWQERDKKLQRSFYRVKGSNDSTNTNNYLRSVIFHIGLRIKNNFSIYSKLMKDLGKALRKATTYEGLVSEIRSEKYSFALSYPIVTK